MRRTWSRLLFWSSAIAICIYITVWHLRPSKADYTEIDLGHGLKTKIHFREKIPSKWNTTVVLLHGNAFDSTVWIRTNTLNVLHQAGYRVIAIDLPGYGYSSGPTLNPSIARRGVILREILIKLNAAQSIIVSPSMSGTYSLPLVVRGDLPLRGFVSVAAEGTDHFTNAEYSMLKIPTCSIYGENDKGLAELSRNRLRHIKGSKEYMMTGAGHACYLHRPFEFNTALLSFFNTYELV